MPPPKHSLSSKRKTTTTTTTTSSSFIDDDFPPVPKCCVVTGGMGFVGRRLVEMLVERGAEKVVAFDISPKPIDADPREKRIVWMRGDLTKLADVKKAVKGADCVWHIAALVGPYHEKEMYEQVNHIGTKNVIEAMKFSTVSRTAKPSAKPMIPAAPRMVDSKAVAFRISRAITKAPRMNTSRMIVR